MVTEQAAQDAKSTLDRAGKYLTFILAEETYGFEILKVREIIGMMAITSIPRTPDFVQGVINLRGKIIPVIDLRLKFGMPSTAQTEETCIIVVSIAEVEVGAVVDRVSEVLEVASGDIENAPSFGVSVNTDFILGMAKVEDRVTILLDVDKVFGAGNIGALAQIAPGSDQEVA